jgi:PadR family transcriptional regulator PadR
MSTSDEGYCHGKESCSCHEYGPRLEGLIVPCLLILLKEKPSHGYEIMEDLAKLDFLKAVPDPGVVYRHLRHMEEGGLAESRLEPGSGGPARKVYSITPEGEEYLLSCAVSIRNMKSSLESFLTAVNRNLELK